MSKGIELRNVHLHYASAAFQERSLKSMLAKSLVPRARQRKAADIHALKNITLSIAPGERVGLVGQNGAGKSTFLKMIAGLYPVSAGTRVVDGAVRSLLELSLGFEPEATGRDNILYRGLLLGLTPKFMRGITPEVISFADLGDFIDYPVKTYSAGMKVRLAFAISTAVGGEILLLDEVIGAGDASFMSKARARIHDLVSRAEILVLASHDLATLRSLCLRGILLHRGEVLFDGDIEQTLAMYRNITEGQNAGAR